MEFRLNESLNALRHDFDEHNRDPYAHGVMLSKAITDRAEQAQRIYVRLDNLESNVSKIQQWQQRLIGAIALSGFMVTVFGAVIVARIFHWF